MLASPDVLHKAGIACMKPIAPDATARPARATGRTRKNVIRFLPDTHVRPSYAAAAKAIHEGVPGSAMDAWPLLTPGEIQAVTFYLRSFYKGPERHQ